MQNYTIEDYKKAIQEKYKIEIAADNFPNPSQANLRNLCWEIFEKNKNPDDLITFKSFFGFEFDPNKRKQFREHTDRFKPIGTFYKVQTDLTDKVAVNLAAILVDFNLRPYNKFRKISFNENEKNIVDSLNLDLGKDNEFSEEIITEKSFDSCGEEAKINSEKNTDGNIKPISFRTKVPEILSKKSNQILLLLFIILFSTCIFFVQRKQCMQWSTDHYEKVSCDLEVTGIGNYNKIEPFDETAFNLKKIAVCDTTTCFDNNGVAIIWYAKTANGVDFFNEHGRHPENNKSLRPVTQYILDKYVKR